MNENDTQTPAATATAAAPASPRLASPYPAAKYSDSAASMRITIDVPKTDVYAIRTVRMDRGTIYFALQNFIQMLANECKRNNWNIDDSSKLEHLILERCASGDAGHLDRPHQDERPRAGVVREDGAGTANRGAARQRKQTKANDQSGVASE